MQKILERTNEILEGRDAKEYDLFEYIENKLIDLNDLLEYSNKYYKHSISEETITKFEMIKNQLTIQFKIKNKLFDIIVGINDENNLDDKFIIETSTKYDIEDSIVNLPRVIDTIDFNKVDSMTMFYNSIYIVCTITHKRQ